MEADAIPRRVGESLMGCVACEAGRHASLCDPLFHALAASNGEAG